MSKRFWMSAAIVALVATSACAPRRPASIPPGPDTSGTIADPNGSTGGQGVVVPGSRADFLQSVPADRVFFDLDSYTLSAQARATLDSQAQWLAANPRVNVTIEGHCDERGTREYNLALGERRATAARIYLESRGVAANRMQTISWGKERPEALGTSDEDYARNRRAVTVVPE